MPLARSFLAGALAAAILGMAAAAPSRACAGQPAAREATARDIAAFVRHRGMTVLTFAGYSGAGYEDETAMLARAAEVLDARDPAVTLVNVGATAQGIGAVYGLAKEKGFATIGIVSVLARDEGVALSPCVDDVFYVRDKTWGGRLPGSARLSPTSAAIVAGSASMIGIGGGDIARDEMLAARRAGKPVVFFPADMDHRLAGEKAAKKGAPAPTPADLRGAAHAVFAGR